MAKNMKILANLMFFMLSVPLLAASSENIPPHLVGSWVVGRPYDTPGPVGVDANQEKFIRMLHIVYGTNDLRVCGKDIPVRSISMRPLDGDEFLQTYGFLGHVVGIRSFPVNDITINPSSGMNACGEHQDPGAHVLIDDGGHVVMEVANDYFPLQKE